MSQGPYLCHSRHKAASILEAWQTGPTLLGSGGSGALFASVTGFD